MPASPSELLQKVQRLAFRARRVSEHLLAGQYHSHFRGKGMTFSQIRRYEFGDDVRAIDWNVTARYQEPYLKVYHEERALNLLLLVDASASMHAGAAAQTKRDLAHELAAVLALAAHQNNDLVGLVLFSDRIEHFVPPQKGYQHLLRLFRDLLGRQPVGRTTDVSEALRFALRMVRRKSIVCVLSDFASADFQPALRLAAARHEVIGMHLADARETDLPDVGWLPVAEAETGLRTLLPTFLPGVRRRYQAATRQHLADVQVLFRNSRADLLTFRTGEEYVNTLRTYFAAR